MEWEEYETIMNPYEYKCSIHGDGYGPIDECPKCMESDYLDSMNDQYTTPKCAICGKKCDHDWNEQYKENYGEGNWYGFSCKDWEENYCDENEQICTTCYNTKIKILFKKGEMNGK